MSKRCITYYTSYSESINNRKNREVTEEGYKGKISSSRQQKNRFANDICWVPLPCGLRFT
jgi:hypothetical protein